MTMSNPTKPEAAVRPTSSRVVFGEGGRVFELYFNANTRRFTVRSDEQFPTVEDTRNAEELAAFVAGCLSLREAASALALLDR
jgi:hypothetical protein